MSVNVCVGTHIPGCPPLKGARHQRCHLCPCPLGFSLPYFTFTFVREFNFRLLLFIIYFLKTNSTHNQLLLWFLLLRLISNFCWNYFSSSQLSVYITWQKQFLLRTVRGSVPCFSASIAKKCIFTFRNELNEYRILE